MWSLNTNICNAQNNEVVPQVEHMGPGYDWDAPESVTQIRVNVPLRFRPAMRAFHLNPATQLTDVISQGYIYTLGLLVSERMYATLTRFDVQAHETHAAEVVHLGRAHPYLWVHMTERVEDRLDYSRSEFVVRTLDGRERPQPIGNAEELRARCIELVNTIEPLTLAARRITFAVDPVHDMFGLVLTQRLFFVSDRVADALRAGRFTGFELVPSEIIISVDHT